MEASYSWETPAALPRVSLDELKLHFPPGARKIRAVSSTSDETDPAFRAARDICRRHARSFYFSSAFLSRTKRDASFAVYAFCRMIDDAIDQDHAAIEGESNPRTEVP